MKILHLCPGQDTAGQANLTKLAFDRLAPEHEFRVVSRSPHRFRYPTDIFPASRERVQAEYDWADVVVIHSYATEYAKHDRGQRKPLVIHHHGTYFRTHPELWAAGEAIGAVQVVSTVDLLLAIPEGGKGVWVPQVVDTDSLAELRRQEYRPSKVIKIAHAPTDRRIKGTAAVIDAVRSLAKRYPVALTLIEHQPWAKCLAMKARADILIDQFNLGYGNNATEGWALGMPVVAGARPEILARMRREYHTRTLPFYEATEENLEARLEELIRDPALRERYAKLGMAHVQKFHSPEAVVKNLVELYSSVPPSVGGPMPQKAPVLPPPRHRYISRRERRAIHRALAQQEVA